MIKANILLAATCLFAAVPTIATAQSAGNTIEATGTLSIAVNKGTLVQLDRPAANVFIANPKVADVQLKSPRLVYVFGTGEGETSFYAVDKDDRPIYAASIRVANNIDQIKQMLNMALPDTQIDVKTLNGLVFLTGTVDSPQAVDQASSLTQSLVGDKQRVVNQLRTATPIQVNLQVKIAEVSRDVLKQIGFNWASIDRGGSNDIGGYISRGRDFAEFNDTGATFTGLDDGTVTIGGLIGLGSLDIAAAIDALEQEGFLTVLAEPNLTALSGEAANFLAGGEFAIPVPGEDNNTAIEYKEYGVGLSFVPIVHSGGRISMRVKPEVSQLTSAGSITVNGISVPGLQTRRAETTVELGSGESFAIAGLLQNNLSQDVQRTPGLGDIPILGALFKSDKFRRQETELVIIVTPYLVKPVDANRIMLPSDGFKASNDANRLLRDQRYRVGEEPAKPAPVGRGGQAAVPAAESTAAQPGFSFGQ